MKKNAMLKIAAILLVAVLLTTCAISATFAKYVKSGSDSTVSARVAKWGVNVRTNFLTNTADGAELFLNEYENADTGFEVKAKQEVVAPGTYNKITITSVATGQPEVSGVVTATPTLTLGNNWEVNDAYYCPLQFRIGTGSWIKGTDFDSTTEFATAVQTAVKQAIDFSFDAGTDLSVTHGVTIEWQWLFSVDAATDAKDTVLGDASNATVQLSVAIDIAQTGAAAAPTT